jgi:hypothetical protein
MFEEVSFHLNEDCFGLIRVDQTHALFF